MNLKTLIIHQNKTLYNILEEVSNYINFKTIYSENLDQIFPDGKTQKGEWIDPATKQPLLTCKYSGKPYIPMSKCSEGSCFWHLIN